MNLQTRDYDYDMLETLSLHAEKFPTIRPGCAIAGHLTEEAAYHLGCARESLFLSAAATACAKALAQAWCQSAHII